MRLAGVAAASAATTTSTLPTDPTTTPDVTAATRRRRRKKSACAAGVAPGEGRLPDVPAAPSPTLLPPLRHYEIALSKLLLSLPKDDVKDSAAASAAAAAAAAAATIAADADAATTTLRMPATTEAAAQLPAPLPLPQTPRLLQPVYHAFRSAGRWSGGGGRRRRSRGWVYPPPAATTAAPLVGVGGNGGGPSPQPQPQPQPPSREDDEKEGQIVDPFRAANKEDQVQSMLLCLEYVLRRRSIHESSSTDRSTDALAPPRRWGITLVDMGGGSGHLAIPAALENPAHRFVVIDLNRRSIDLLKIKAARTTVVDDDVARQQQELEEDDDDEEDVDDPNDDFLASNPSLPLEVTAIPNLYALCGSIEQFLLCERPKRLAFEVGLALHLCGQSTDVAIRACMQQNAALVAVPCCVGKISTTRHNPYVWQATNSNISTIKYPQSKLYKHLLNDDGVKDDSTTTSLWWNALAGAADDSTRHVTDDSGRRHHGRYDPIDDDDDAEHERDPVDCPSDRSAVNEGVGSGSSSDKNHRRCCCRAAKILVEWDRCLYLQEHGYETVLTRMVPISASPKHDIIVATPKSWRKVSRSGSVDETTNDEGDDDHDPTLAVDHDAVKDLARTRDYLRVASSGCVRCTGGADPSQSHLKSHAMGSDDEVTNGTWSKAEVAEVRELLAAHFALSDVRASSDHISNGLRQSGDVFYFPKGMGRGRRKLVHYVAGTLGLEHWSHGKKQGTGKTVAVALPGTRRRLQSYGY